MLYHLLLTTFAALALGADAEPAELYVGDRAPKLDVETFVKGEPVKKFEKGKTYVVEFWATWCGPCIQLIPHLTELQKSHDKVVFIGVSIDEDPEAVKPFVERMGAKMDYRVALETRDDDEGRMSTAWLKASFQENIPTAFVINGDGRIAWIGHPADLKAPLEQILAGKWDLAAKAEEFKKAIADQRAAAELRDGVAAALKEGKYDAALKLIDEATAKHAALADDFAWTKLALLAGFADDPAPAVELAKKLVEKATKEDDAMSLLTIANVLVDPAASLADDIGQKPAAKKVDARLVKLAVKAAEKADQVSELADALERAQIALLLAKAYRLDGQNDKAKATVDGAVTALNETIQHATDAIRELGDLKMSLPDAGEDKEKAK